MSAGGGSRKLRGGTPCAGRGWHGSLEPAPTQSGESLPRATCAAELKRTTPVSSKKSTLRAERRATGKTTAQKPAHGTKKASERTEAGAVGQEGGQIAAVRPTARPAPPKSKTESVNRLSNYPKLSRNIMESQKTPNVVDAREMGAVEQRPVDVCARRSATPSSGCSESGRSPQKISVYDASELALSDLRPETRGKKRGSHQHSCSEASSCTGSGASSGPSGMQDYRDLGGQVDIQTNWKKPTPDPPTQTCETGPVTVQNPAAGSVERPCTPVAPPSTSACVPPGAPRRPSNRKRASELSERLTEPRVHPHEGAMNADMLRADDVSESLIEECAERMLLRRGHCAVCGQFRPLRPSAAVCFNLQCKILYDSR
jgi:hypothetical protein